jgi:hypothetical protein
MAAKGTFRSKLGDASLEGSTCAWGWQALRKVRMIATGTLDAVNKPVRILVNKINQAARLEVRTPNHLGAYCEGEGVGSQALSGLRDRGIPLEDS